MNNFTNSKLNSLFFLFVNSSLPILREFGFKREARSLLNDASTLSMLKIWVGLEVRQLMHLSMKQIYDLVRTDQLCPNY